MIKKISHYLSIVILGLILIAVLGFIIKTCFGWHQNIADLMIDKTYHLKEVLIFPTDKAEQKIILGRDTLGQIKKGDSAEQSHLALRYENNQWLISNIAIHKRAYVYTDKGQQFFLKRRQIALGDHINLGQRGIEITNITEHQLTLFDHNTQQTREINTVNPVLLNLPPIILDAPLHSFKRCDGLETDPSIIERLRKTMQGWKTEIVESKPIKFGGQIDCPEQFAVKNVPENSLQIVYSRGHFYYAAGHNAQLVTIKRQNQTLLASQAEYPIFANSYGQINKIIMGRTRYQITQNNNHILMFKPLNHIHLFLTEDNVPKLQKSANIRMDWVILSYKSIGKPRLKGIIVIVALIILLFLLLFLFKKITIPMKIILFLSTIGACISILFYFSQKEGTLYSPQILIDFLIFQWSCAAIMITLRTKQIPFLHGILSLLFWLLVTFLAGAGIDALSQLALGANDTQWRVYLDKQIYSLIAISFITVLFVALSKYNWWSHLTEQFIFNDQFFQFKKFRIRIGTFYRVVPLMSLAFLYGLWLVMGTEAGVNGIQPVEPGKFFVLIILSIIVSMFFLAFSYGDAGKRILDIMITGLPFLILMLLMFIITPLLKSDQSPILIILLSSLLLTICITFIFTFHLLSWQYHNLGRLENFQDFNLKRLIIPLVLFCIFLIGTFTLYHGVKYILSLHDNPPEWVSDPDQQKNLHTIAERILAWQNPLKYPDESYQLRRAITLIAESPKEKESEHKINDFNSMAVPAVQDDFILSFYLYRFGTNAGKQLFLIQLLFIGCLFLIAIRVYRWKKGDYRDTAVRQFLAFSVMGFAISQSIHWVIAWSNSFNFLPIMGQPMTWLSSGNSHLLGFALPGILITLTAIYSVKKAPSNLC